MEILLLVTVIAVAAACLFVAVTFNKRAKLINDSINQISDRVDDVAKSLTQQLSVLTEEARQHHEEMHDRLDHTDAQVSNVSSLVLTELETMRQLLGDQIDTPQNERHEAPAGTSSLVQAMLEAEAHMDGKGWGVPPYLYALTEQSSSISASHEFPADVHDATPGRLVLVEREPLPEGEVIGALRAIGWPADVVGCVLVAELAHLPPRVEGDVPIDPGAAEQRSSARPDGRPARLTVGVCGEGQYACGIRVKGEAEVRIWTEPGNELVTALLDTFSAHRDRGWISGRAPA